MSQHLEKIRQAFFLVTMAVAAFPIVPLKLAVFFIVVWILSSIILAVADKNRDWKKGAGIFALFTAIFLLHLLSYFFTNPPEGSYHYLERRLSLLIFPLGFYLNFKGFGEKQLKSILQVFEYAAVILVIYIAVDVVPLIMKHWDLVQEGINFNWHFRTRIENITNIHPTYLSIILLFAIFLKLERFVRKEMSNLFIVLEGLQVILMLTCCLLLSARGPLISFVFALIIYFLQVNWKRAIIGMAMGLPVVVILFSSVPAISNRFQELAEISTPPQDGEELSSTRVRQRIFNCSIEVLKDNWVTGVGLANVQTKLNQCYDRLNDASFSEMEYNTHNQYLHIWISSGLLGIGIFLLSLVWPLYLAYSRGDSIYLFFIIVFSVCFLTENLLARQHGVVMFAFFNSLMAFNLIYRKD